MQSGREGVDLGWMHIRGTNLRAHFKVRLHTKRELIASEIFPKTIFKAADHNVHD